jgi:glutathione S-transferase
MIRLYWCPRTRAMRALWLLEEAGVPFERVSIDIRNEESRAHADFRRVSPLGKVPALEDGPVRLTDSGAMCLYVADAYPSSGLAPPVGHPDRGAYLQWATFTNACIEPAMLEKHAGLPPKPHSYGWGDLTAVLATLREGLKRGPWILGERFSAADVLLGTAAHFLVLFKTVSDDAILEGYARRCLQRPAAQRALAAEG